MNREEPTTFVSWMACEHSFYMDGMRIDDFTAVRLWRSGGVTFMPQAAERARAISAFLILSGGEL